MTFGIPHLLGGIVFLVALLRLREVGIIHHTTDTMFGWLALIAALAYVTVLAGPISQLAWTGYIYFCVIAAYLTMGLIPALFMVILGSGLAVMWLYRLDIHSPYLDASWRHVVDEYMARVAIAGIGAIAGHGMYHVLGGTIPFIHMDSAPHLMVALVSNVVAALVMLLVGLLAVGENHYFYLEAVNRSWLVDFSLQMAGLVVSVVLSQISLSAMLVVLALIVFQAAWFRQIRRTRDQLARRGREVSTLSTLGHAVSGSLSLDEVLTIVHEQLYTLVKPTIVISALYDEGSDAVEFPAVVVSAGEQKPLRRKLSAGLTDWVIRNRKPLHLNMLETASFDRMGIDLALVDVQAYVGVPLIVGDKLIGVLAVGHDTEFDAFDAVDVNVLQTIATQTALAIRNANLYNRSLRLANNMAIINQSLQQVMFNLDRNALVQTACYIASQITGAEYTAVFTVHERLGMQLIAQQGMDRLLPDEFSIPYWTDAYEDGSRVTLNVEDSHDRDLRELSRIVGFHTALEVPLRSSNTIVGMIGVYHQLPHVYEATDINLMEMLAKQITAAFDNTDLLQALELYASEQSQLVHLARISSSNLDLERVINDLIATLEQIISVPRVDVAIFRTASDMDCYHAIEGELIEHSTLRVDEIPEVQIVIDSPHLATPYTLYLQDESISNNTRAYMQAHKMEMLAIMPMSISRQVFGVLLLSAPEPIVILDNTRRLLEMAIHQVSAQVHNARLYTITEAALSQQLEQLSLIEEIAQKISQSLNVNAVMDNMMDAVLRAMSADQAEIFLQGSADRWQIFRKQKNGEVFRGELLLSEVTPDILNLMAPRSAPADDLILTQYGVSTLYLPLLSGERTLGVLRIVSHQKNVFGHEEVNFIRSLAGHAAISIDNAFLLEERQFQVNALTSLRELSLEVVGNVDEAQVTRSVLQTTLEMLEANEVSLYGYDSRTDEVVPMSGLRRTRNGYEAAEPHLIPQPIYRAVVSHEIVIEQLALTRETDPQGHLIYPTMIAIPIVRYNQVREVLVLGFDSKREVMPHDLNVIDLLSVQVASHLENILLNQTIRTSNNRMRAILDSTRDGIILLDNFGRIQDSNRSAADLLGVDLSSATGELFARFIQQRFPDDRSIVERLMPANDYEGEIREIELSGDTNPLHLQVMALPVRDANGDNMGRLLSVRDVTQDRQLAMMRDSLQRMVIHDLRSPMGAIITGMSFINDLMEEVDPSVSDDIRRTVDASLESADNLMRLMDTLRDIPHMKDMELDLQPVPLRTLISKAYESLEALFVEVGITFEIVLQREDEVQVDIDLMRRVLINLLHNALKFTPENGHIMVLTDNQTEPDFVRVLVCDDGPGIPVLMRERIFGEFQQVVGQIPKRGGRGTGLGLTLCKLVVEAHGGTIQVTDEGPLSGACFVFTLPLNVVPELT